MTVRMAVPLVAAALLAGGCSGSPEPSTLPTDTPATSSMTPSPTATPEPSATRTPSAKPTKTSKPTPTPTKPKKDSLKAELYATTKAFYAAITKSAATLDIGALQRISTKDCKACAQYLTFYRSVKKRHERFTKTGAFRVSDFHVTHGYKRGSKVRSATFVIEHSKAVRVDSTGKVVGVSKPFKAKRLMQYRKEGNSWRVYSEVAQGK